MFFFFFSEKNSLNKTFLVECVRSGAASCNKRREFWRETRTSRWFLIGRIIFLTREKTSFAILIGRIIFFTSENHRSLLWLARINFRTKIYDIAFWWVFLSTYIIKKIAHKGLFCSPQSNQASAIVYGKRVNCFEVTAGSCRSLLHS